MLTEEMIGLGIENITSREELCRRSGLKDSAMRAQMEKLKTSGVVICSSCKRKGYFRPRKDRPHEVAIARHDYEERKRKALSMLAQNKSLQNFLYGDGQMELEFDADL